MVNAINSIKNQVMLVSVVSPRRLRHQERKCNRATNTPEERLHTLHVLLRSENGQIWSAQIHNAMATKFAHHNSVSTEALRRLPPSTWRSQRTLPLTSDLASSQNSEATRSPERTITTLPFRNSKRMGSRANCAMCAS